MKKNKLNLKDYLDLAIEAKDLDYTIALVVKDKWEYDRLCAELSILKEMTQDTGAYADFKLDEYPSEETLQNAIQDEPVRRGVGFALVSDGRLMWGSEMFYDNQAYTIFKFSNLEYFSPYDLDPFMTDYSTHESE